MASVTTRPNGDRWVQFEFKKKRHTLRLGSVSIKIAEKHKRTVESLIASRLSRCSIEPADAEFIGSIDEDLRKRYAKCGLIELADQPKEPETKPITLGEYLKSYFDSRKQDVKPSTWIFYQHTINRLNEHFGKDRELASITPVDGKQFRKWLEQSNKRDKPEEGKGPRPLAVNTIKRRTGLCRQIFAQAVHDGIVARNPFVGMSTAVRANKDRQHYVDLDTFNKVLESAPNARWKALLVLARLGALRIPSEASALKWDHIAWEAKRISIVSSSKTEHHANRRMRLVPLLPAIEAELLKLHLEAPSGDYVFPELRADSNLRTTLEKIIARAGVKQWPKLWQNLRASDVPTLRRLSPVTWQPIFAAIRSRLQPSTTGRYRTRISIKRSGYWGQRDCQNNLSPKAK